MKLDIEGFEYRALEHFFKTSPKAQWPEHIIFERHPNLVDADAEGGDTLDLLQSHGYLMAHDIGLNIALTRRV